MPHYICITHVRADQAAATRLSETLLSHGFQNSCIHEATESAERTRVLFSATVVIALTSPEAHRVGSVADDLKRLSAKNRTALCVSLADNPIDHLYGGEREPGAACAPVECIPYPEADSSDAQSEGLFIHRLLICRLAPIPGLFSSNLCGSDTSCQTVAHAAAAYKGDMAAAYALGCAYERGEGVPIQEDSAAEWITRAADGGSADAKLHLGELCLIGRGVERDTTRTVALFSEVAGDGDPRAEYRMGLCYLNGVGVVADPFRAVRYLRCAARRDYPPALFRLGLLARDGVGLEEDAVFAMRCLYRACRLGAENEAAGRQATDQPSTAPAAVQADGVNKALRDRSATASADPLPPPLSNRRTAKANSFRTLRTLRPTLLRMLKAKSTGTSPEAPPTIASGGSEKAAVPVGGGEVALPFARSRRIASRRPEDGWLDRLPSVGADEPRGTAAVYVDSERVAMGIPFVLSDVAVALGAVLASCAVCCKHVPAERGRIRRPRPHATRALVWYRYALRRGNAEALFRLAEAYRMGLGTLADPDHATRLYRLSAEWGDVRGQFAYAVACERAIGLDALTGDLAENVHAAKAADLYRAAAEAGYPPAQNNLGGYYEYGVVVEKNIFTAVEWYTRAAEAGLPEAMCRLGLCFECGRGVPKNLSRAIGLYKKAEALNSAYALYRLGVCCDHGLYRSSEACPTEGVTEQEHGDAAPLRTQAARYWIRAALAGLPEAAYAVAMCYAHGHGVRIDRDNALLFLKAAAAGDHLPAVYRLAMCYLEGNGVVPNAAHAVKLLEHAVLLWNSGKNMYFCQNAPSPRCAHTPVEAAADALYMLGLCIRENIGREEWQVEEREDPAKRAVELFTESAELGHTGAYVALGDLYAYGHMKARDGQAETAKLIARMYYMRAVLISSKRRSVRCALSLKDQELCEHNQWLPALPECMHLPAVSLPDLRAEGLLSSEADSLNINSAQALLTLAWELVPGGRRNGFERVPSEETRTACRWKQVWRYLSSAAAQGSMEAQVDLAYCDFFGLGCPQDPKKALRRLQLATQTSSCGIRAYMWLGDFYRIGLGGGECRPMEADTAYLRGLSVPESVSEGGPYILSDRRREDLMPEKQVRAELLYRIARHRSSTLMPKELSEYQSRKNEYGHAFDYLAEATLLGHAEARKDMMLMYEYAQFELAEKMPETKAEKADVKEEDPTRRMHRQLRRLGRFLKAGKPTIRSHWEWPENYYVRFWKDLPSIYETGAEAASSDRQSRPLASISVQTQADVLNYLGDYYFDGEKSKTLHSPEKAVVFYSEAVSLTNDFRPVDMPESGVWARYSLGWCQLKGKGVRRDERAAVKLLEGASDAGHPEASFLLGECHEGGIGVDKPDLREAIKRYRIAAKQGYPGAKEKVNDLEKIQNERDTAAEKRGRFTGHPGATGGSRP